MSSTVPPPSAPFPVLLLRVVRIDVSHHIHSHTLTPSYPYTIILSHHHTLTHSHTQSEVLKAFEWNHPEKLKVGCGFDLSRPVSKESSFLKMVAEQLTLMEFAVYAVVQRR